VSATVLLLALATSGAGIDLESRGFGTFRPTVGHFNLAKYFHAKGRFAEARGELLRALAAEEERVRAGAKPWGRAAEIHTDIALIAIARARGTDAAKQAAARDAFLEEARTHLDRAESLAPRFARIHWERGAWHRLKGNTRSAVACFEKALALQPSLHDARLHLAETIWERGDRARSRTLLEEVIEKAPKAARAEAHHMLGQIALLEKETEEARRRWESALQCDPRHLASLRQLMNLHRRRTESYLAKKDIETANVELARSVAYAEMVIRIDPSDETARALILHYQKAQRRRQPRP
jgi:FimV-like protein